MSKLSVVRFGGAALIVASATLAFSANGASALSGTVPPESGDARAVVVSGNATTCAGAGLTGTTVDGADLVRDGRAAPSDDQTMVTISSAAPDTTISAIVVKGGDAYNLYEPGRRGLDTSLPYTDLHSPLVGQNDNVPTISHWFVCTAEAGSPGGPGAGSPGAGPTGGGTGTGGTGTGSTAGSGPGGQVDSATTPAPNSQPGALANTGFDPTVPTILAVLLLAVGGLMLTTPRQVLAAVARLRRR